MLVNAQNFSTADTGLLLGSGDGFGEWDPRRARGLNPFITSSTSDKQKHTHVKNKHVQIACVCFCLFVCVCL